MNVLAVVAHNDDETLGPGGTLARHVAHGDQVAVAVACLKSWGSADAAMLAARYKTMTLAACADLGVTDVRFGPFHTGDLHKEFMVLLQWVEDLIDQLAIDVLYTHHEHDRHQDHRTLAEIGVIVFRPTARLRELHCFEVVGCPLLAQPNRFVDVTPYMERKEKAMRRYWGAEVFDYPHSRSIEVARSLSVARGAEAGVALAEAFCSQVLVL